MEDFTDPAFLQRHPQAALIVRQDGRIMAANALAAALLLYPADQFSSLTLWDLISAEYHSLFEPTRRELAVPPGFERELLALDRDQRRIPVAVRVFPLPEDLMGIELRDLRPIKEARASYQRQTAILRAVADASYQLFHSTQPEGEIPPVLAQLGNAADVSRVYI
ncbi:MAG: PAS domain-containing protein, partial [Bellilinea sp.]